MTFSFGFSFANLGDDRVDLVLPGVDGDDGAVLPVSGDMDFFPDLDALIITLGGGGSLLSSQCLITRTADCHLHPSVLTLLIREFACPHRLWHGRCWALQNECDGGRDALVRMPTPPQHVDEDFSSIGVKVMWWRDEQSKI